MLSLSSTPCEATWPAFTKHTGARHRRRLRRPPRRLRVKYPSAPREWPWQWTLPASRHYMDEATGQLRRHQVHETVVQRAVRSAPRAIGATKPITPPSCATARDPPPGGRLRHPDHARAPRPQGREHHDDLHPRPQPRPPRRPQPPRRTMTEPMSIFPVALGTLLELATPRRCPTSWPSLSKTSGDLEWLRRCRVSQGMTRAKPLFRGMRDMVRSSIQSWAAWQLSALIADFSSVWRPGRTQTSLPTSWR
jgi:hypothetical protein